MTTDFASTTNQEHEANSGHFYVIGPDIRTRDSHGVVFANVEDLLTPPRRILRPEQGGFPTLRAPPLLVHDPAQGEMPRDLEATFSGYWLVSEELKNAFQSTDPEGFAFLRCDFRLADGTQGAPHYLCDIVRTLDALDEDKSQLRIVVSDEYSNGKYYHMGGGAKLVFKADQIGEAHVFRTPYSAKIFCDHVLHVVIISQALTGIWFVDASDY